MGIAMQTLKRGDVEFSFQLTDLRIEYRAFMPARRSQMKSLVILIILVVSSTIYAQDTKSGPDAAIWLDNGFIGGVDHKVTTKSAEAQKYFNQGLGCIYGSITRPR
jgi:hypothetical protein